VCYIAHILYSVIVLSLLNTFNTFISVFVSTIVIMLHYYYFSYLYKYIFIFIDIPLSIIPTHFHLQRCVKHCLFISLYYKFQCFVMYILLFTIYFIHSYFYVNIVVQDIKIVSKFLSLHLVVPLSFLFDVSCFLQSAFQSVCCFAFDHICKFIKATAHLLIVFVVLSSFRNIRC
jgi:hypothetical protein